MPGIALVPVECSGEYASVIATYRITRNLSLVAKAWLREVVSNDIRIQYDRTQYVLGVRWEQ